MARLARNASRPAAGSAPSPPRLPPAPGSRGSNQRGGNSLKVKGRGYSNPRSWWRDGGGGASAGAPRAPVLVTAGPLRCPQIGVRSIIPLMHQPTRCRSLFLSVTVPLKARREGLFDLGRRYSRHFSRVAHRGACASYWCLPL